MDIGQMAVNWMQGNPKIVAALVALLVVNVLFKAFTDALVDVKAEADKPAEVKNGFDKVVRGFVLASLFLQRLVFHLAGVNTVQLQKLSAKKQ